MVGRLWIRSFVSMLLIGLCLFLCLGFWLTQCPWNAVVLGRYSVKWFIGSVVANTALILFTGSCLRALWGVESCRNGGETRLPFRKRCLFGAVILGTPMLAAELVLPMLDIGVKSGEPLIRAGTAKYYHGLLQHAEREQVDGRLVRTYRGRKYGPKQPGSFRIACLGGSTTWGQTLPACDTWPRQLELILQANGYDVDVINAGRAWFTSAHSFVNYGLQIRRYDPDVVVIMHGINDVVRSFPRPGEPDAEPDYGGYQGPMTDVLAQYERAVNRRPLLTESNLSQSILYRLVCEHTAINRRYYGLLRPPERRVERVSIDIPPTDLPTIETLRSNLEYLARLCRMDGRGVVIATQAHVYNRDRFDALAPVVEMMRTAFLVTRDGRALSRSGTREVMRAVRRININVALSEQCRLADVESAVGGDLSYFIDDFHLNARGNLVAAGAVSTVVGDMLQRLSLQRQLTTERAELGDDGTPCSPKRTTTVRLAGSSTVASLVLSSNAR